MMMNRRMQPVKLVLRSQKINYLSVNFNSCMKQFRTLYLPLLLACICIRANAQAIMTSATSDPSADPARLAIIDTIANEYISKGWINGVVTLVIRDNRVVQYKGYGFSDKEAKKPMQKDDLFRIAS